MNVLVTVGSLPYPFDRVVEAADAWAAAHPEHRAVMQIGYSEARPAHAAEAFTFEPFEDFQAHLEEAGVLVAHGSAGPILAARRRGLPIVLVPRQARHGECYNDHQVETCEALRGESAMREIVLEISDLGEAIGRALEKRRAGAAYGPHLLKDRLVATIRRFVETLEA